MLSWILLQNLTLAPELPSQTCKSSTIKTMVVKKSQYETVLAEYSSVQAAIALLKQHRPYLEMIPSMRRISESLIVIPLPIVRIRSSKAHGGQGINETPEGLAGLPCDLGILMCDPEWKVKTGVEIFVFIHRPEEDFSDLLTRWRKTQIWLDRGYEWVMPSRYKHIISEGAEKICPLFVLFPGTPDRVKKGLQSNYLPFVIENPELNWEESSPEAPSPEELKTED